MERTPTNVNLSRFGRFLSVFLRRFALFPYRLHFCVLTLST